MCRGFEGGSSCEAWSRFFPNQTSQTVPSTLQAQSWTDPWVSSATSSQLASLPSYVNIVCVAFMLPDASYSGGVTFEGTGLSFRWAAQYVKLLEGLR